MAVEVVAINPSKARKKGSTKKGKKSMAKAKKKRKKSGAKKKRRRNPSVKKYARRAGARAKQSFFGMNIWGAANGVVPRGAGMLAAKWMAKKFPGVEGGGDQDNWTWANYLAGGFGGLLAGFIAENLKRGAGQKVLEGAFDLMFYKMLQNEVIPESEFLTDQFGAYDDEPIVMLGEGQQANAGDMLLGDDGQYYMMGQDGYTRPIDESHRQLAAQLAQNALQARPLNGDLQPPGPLGGELERPGTLGEMAVYPPSRRRQNDPYVTAYAGRG